MKYYTKTIPATLAEKLKEKGCEHPYAIPEAWEYGFIFDWLMEKGFSCEITRFVDFAYEQVCPEWDWTIEKVGPLSDAPGGYAGSWHGAANAAIEKALELIKED